jgi:hypothetical protein
MRVISKRTLRSAPLSSNPIIYALKTTAVEQYREERWSITPASRLGNPWFYSGMSRLAILFYMVSFNDHSYYMLRYSLKTHNDNFILQYRVITNDLSYYIMTYVFLIR